MKILFVIIFTLLQFGGAANSPPPLKDDARILVTQDELESFLRLLVLKRLELERISLDSDVEAGVKESVETTIKASLEAKNRILEPISENQASKPHDTKPKVSPDAKSELQHSSEDIKRLEDTLRRLEESIKALKQIGVDNQLDTTFQTNESVLANMDKTVSSNNQVRESIKTVGTESLEQRIEAQNIEISYLKSMIETLAARELSAAPAVKPQVAVPQQPMFVLSGQHSSPVTRSLLEERIGSADDDLIRVILERMDLEQKDLAFEQLITLQVDSDTLNGQAGKRDDNVESELSLLGKIPSPVSSIATDAMQKEAIEDVETPKLYQRDPELELMIENFLLKLDMERLSKELDSLRNEVSDLKSTVGELSIISLKPEKEEREKEQEDVKGLTVFFANNSFQLGAADRKGIRDLAANVADDKSKRLNINGYSSAIGSAQYNMQLSKRRAEEVKRAFIAEGIDSERIEIFYFGADPDTPEELARRVEVKIK